MPADVQITGPAVAVNDQTAKSKNTNDPDYQPRVSQQDNNYVAFAEQSVDL
jgi:hypothetical protein